MSNIIIDVAVVGALFLYVFIGMVVGRLVARTEWEETCVAAGMFWPLVLPFLVGLFVCVRMYAAAGWLVDLATRPRSKPIPKATAREKIKP